MGMWCDVMHLLYYFLLFLSVQWKEHKLESLNCIVLSRYEPKKSVPGIRLVPKLKYEHINFTSFSKMRVDLAAHAGWYTLCAYSILICIYLRFLVSLFQMTGGEGAEQTAIFVSMFDKSFDCLNYNSGTQKRKPFLEPYRSPDDERLKWLKDVFFIYIWIHGRAVFFPCQKV